MSSLRSGPLSYGFSDLFDNRKVLTTTVGLPAMAHRAIDRHCTTSPETRLSQTRGEGVIAP